MEREIEATLRDWGAELVRFVDIAGLPTAQALGFPCAILFGITLSKQFVLEMREERPTARDEYLEKEHSVEALADRLADMLRQSGWNARAQSESNNLKNGCIEGGLIDPALQSGISSLPQKTIAQLGGLGFVGKSNLLVTREYGSALALCSVLTNAPVHAVNPPVIASKCGDCVVCKDICPGRAIQGSEWTQSGGRESLVDISKCCCALKCMVHCPWTLRYAESASK